VAGPGIGDWDRRIAAQESRFGDQSASWDGLAARLSTRFHLSRLYVIGRPVIL
jgi:hypothetical protein